MTSRSRRVLVAGVGTIIIVLLSASCSTSSPLTWAEAEAEVIAFVTETSGLVGEDGGAEKRNVRDDICETGSSFVYIIDYANIAGDTHVIADDILTFWLAEGLEVTDQPGEWEPDASGMGADAFADSGHRYGIIATSRTGGGANTVTITGYGKCIEE